MASAVEVVCQAESIAVAEIALDGEVRLLRVGVNEILGLRITEGLEAERQESALSQVEIVLVEEDRIEAYSRSLETAAGSAGRTRIGDLPAEMSEARTLGLIERVPGKSEPHSGCRVAGGPVQQPGAGERQLAAAGTVGRIAQEIKAEQRMIIEHVRTKRGRRSCRLPWDPTRCRCAAECCSCPSGFPFCNPRAL